jgi:hypothetical protein
MVFVSYRPELRSGRAPDANKDKPQAEQAVNQLARESCPENCSWNFSVCVSWLIIDLSSIHSENQPKLPGLIGPFRNHATDEINARHPSLWQI